MAVEFQTIDKRQAQEMFSALPREAKWAPIVGALMNGQSVFVPHMTRGQLESVRTIVNYRRFGRLRSKSTEVDGVEGKLLRVQRPGGV